MCFLSFSLPNRGSENDLCLPPAEPLETDPLSGDGRGGVPTTGWWLTWQQLRALFIKRWLYARRSRRGFLAQVTARTFAVWFFLDISVKDLSVLLFL